MSGGSLQTVPRSLDIAAFSPSVSVSASLSDPAGSDVLVAAVAWLERTVLGTVATTIAVIAVSFIGFRMLSGRVSIRQGATVILGCFILFGASAIVAGLRALTTGDLAAAPYAADPAPPPQVPPAPPGNSDPYAGAAVPQR